ncbi:MAG TPA: hypothetical protein VH277_19020 [Gemmatimonadaceae bacterium]|nr:hypothetical protein [Gemmatimonadaceae bacterium]
MHPPRLATFVAALVAVAAISPLSRRGADAQLIQIKTLPIADGDQWRVFPSANAAMADISIALADSLLDPFVNPAKGARVARGGSFFGAPNFYSVSEKAGGGQTFPLGGIVRVGSLFASFAAAFQQIDSTANAPQFLPPNALTVGGTPLQRPTASHQNRYAFASLGQAFPSSGLSIAASVFWSGLHDVDGTDQLYAGSAGVAQHGGAVDARLGVMKEWDTPAGARTAEAILLHNHFSNTHDVTWPEEVWDPNARTFVELGRVDHNLDRTDTWGLHLAYMQPVGDSGWRVGAIATGNRASHPKLPDYQLAQVSVIPWDPGQSTAVDLGLGVSRVVRTTTIGLDAIYEPIVTHTWGEAQVAIPAASGETIPVGGMTMENRFRFSNGIVRAGASQDVLLGGDQRLRLQLGVAVRSINYGLDQTDHVAATSRHQDESWNEWTKAWGVSFHVQNIELRYTGRTVTGTGRPGVVQPGVVFAAAAVDDGGRDILAAPNGSLSLTGVSVTTHQFSVAIPLR